MLVNGKKSYVAFTLSCLAACSGTGTMEIPGPLPVPSPSGGVEQTPVEMQGAPARPAATCGESARIQPRLYRLSAGQYGNALKDLLGVTAIPDLVGDTEATLQFYPREDAPVQSSIGEGFSRASRLALQNLDLEALSGCTGANAELPSAGATTCAQSFLDDFAGRAFRRPLDQADREALYLSAGSPFATGNATGAANGMRLALEAVLNAPSFLYRRELGTGEGGRLSSLETAEQLAFLLRDSIPDEALWDAGLANQLQTDEQISAQVDRLLADPVVQANITRVVGAWFGSERVLQVSKDPVLFPGFNQNNLQEALFESNRLFIHDVLWNGTGELSTLLDSPRVFLNGNLAGVYGIPFDGDDPSEFIPFDRPDERAGILTQPALMAAFASSLETSIVKRGLFIVRRAMCLPAPPAPTPEIFALATAQAADLTQTEREKAAYRNDPANPCSGCHGLIDPYGIIFENYDAIGRYRTTLLDGDGIDASTTMQEQVIMTEEQSAADEDFTEVVANARDFTGRISETEQFAYCGSKQMLSYALGREVEDSCVREDLENGLLQRDMTIREVIRNVVLDDLTRRRNSAGGM